MPLGPRKALELSLSEGLVSSLRAYEGANVVQTTAAISAGSSAGGIFDDRGQLVGITTFQMREGQNLNFALPTEWVVGLKAFAASPPRYYSTEDLSKEEAFDSFLSGLAAERQGQWQAAIVAFQKAIVIRADFPEAWANLGGALVASGKARLAIRHYSER